MSAKLFIVMLSVVMLSVVMLSFVSTQVNLGLASVS